MRDILRLLLAITALHHIVLAFKQLLVYNGCNANPMQRTLSTHLRSETTTFRESTIQHFSVTASASMVFDGDVLILPVYKPPMNGSILDLSTAIEYLHSNIKDAIADVVDDGSFKAERHATVLVRLFSPDTPKYLALIGLGQKPRKPKVAGSITDVSIAISSGIGRAVAGIGKDSRAKRIGIIMPPSMGNSGLNALFGALNDEIYTDFRYREKPEHGKQFKASEITLLGCSENVARDIKLTHMLSGMIGSGVNFAKDLVGAPANCKTPLMVADISSKLAKDYNMDCKILGEEECRGLGMGAYLGVQQGSKFPPRFIHMTYKPANPPADGSLLKIALVGKGLTFDTGGYNLKLSGMETMKLDVGGCAAILGCAKAISQLRPRHVEVHFITAVCENMVSADAMRPGDVLTASNGKTIEIINTDAEGRLTLADALVYADKLNVDAIIDLATLTDAAVTALGVKMAALYSNSVQLRKDLLGAATRADEGLWHMPLLSNYRKIIKSTTADLKNSVGGRVGGGSITAALFLQEFVGPKTKWAHIDMAGPVCEQGRATGYGVKMLVDYLLNARKRDPTKKKKGRKSAELEDAAVGATAADLDGEDEEEEDADRDVCELGAPHSQQL